MRYLNLDFVNDKQIYTNYPLLETITTEGNQSKEDCEDEEKKPKVQFLFDVKYIFGKVEDRKILVKIVAAVKRELEATVKFKQAFGKTEEDRAECREFELMLKMVNNLPKYISLNNPDRASWKAASLEGSKKSKSNSRH